MEATNRFNLVDEPWIPVAGAGLVSLHQVFTIPGLRALGGNPVQKIAVTKLLLAVAQAAVTPEDEFEWEALGPDGLSSRIVAYLDAKKDCFWLYGLHPFLQMPAVAVAELQSFGAVVPSISTGNTTVLTESQIEYPFSDAERALLVVQLMGFGLGGKKCDNSVVLSAGYAGKSNDNGKPSTGRPGASVGFLGYLHNFMTGESLWATIWINLVTQEQLRRLPIFPQGLGPIPWETSPIGESCPVAQALQHSLIGRLIPFSRFLLLEEDGLRYSEGISHPGHKDGLVDPTVAVDFSGKDPRVLWVDPEKRPWRHLTSLLSFIHAGTKGQFDCLALRVAYPRARMHWREVGLWSGGLKVSNNAGEQYVSGTDDYVESEVRLSTSFLGETWFQQLQLEMGALEDLAKTLYGSCMRYQKALKGGDQQAGQATGHFWQLVGSQFQTLVNACNNAEEAKALRRTLSWFAQQAYDTQCPHDTARQLDAWAAHRPNLGKYLA